MPESRTACVRPVRLECALVVAITALLLSACDARTGARQSVDSGKTTTLSTAKPSPSSTSYATALAELSSAIDKGRQLSARSPDDGLLPLEIVSLYLERARLTGDYEDYANAESLLVAEEGRAAKSASGCIAWARLHYALHRLQQARAALNSCPAGADRSEVLALGADIDFYTGRYKEADDTARMLVNGVGQSSHFTRLALMRNNLGAPGEAAAFLEAAEKRYHGPSATMKAWLKLQRGLLALDRGRFDEALALYQLADAELPGWWLVEEHIAEVQWLTGNTEKARALYEAVVRKTQAPEFLDALAEILASQGQRDQAAKLTAQARATYEQRLRKFPEASAGHALDHFLGDESLRARALELAQANFRNRSHGTAAIALANAWQLNNKPAAAVALLEAELARGWSTAEFYWTLSEVLQATGNAARAAQMKAEAVRRNPNSAKMYGARSL